MPRPPNPDVRDRLCSAGGDLIQRASFGATGVQDITSAAGVPKGSFYNYFDSKEVYAVEILDEYWALIDRSYGPFLRDTALPPLEAIRRFFDGLVAYHRERGFVPGCLIGNLSLELAATNERVREKLDQLFDHWTAGLTIRLEEARRTGALHKEADVAEIAAALVEAFEGAVMKAKVDQSPVALQRYATFVLPRLIT